MVAGARTFTLEDTFLEPQVLNPPPTRHALLVFLLALAAVLHLASAGWSDLYDGTEGQFAGGAREMLETQQWFVPTNNNVPQLQNPPLVYWLIVLSYKIFGVSAAAARAPIAIAMIASVALTFLIGERLANYWRGFAAGLIYLCSAGAFLPGRIVTPDAVFAAFIVGAIFCAVCGYQRRRFRRAWFAGVWLCAALACLSKGPAALPYLAALFVLLAIFFREARLRFRLLLHWTYLIPFLLLVAPWFVWTENHFPGFFLRSLTGSNESRLPAWQFAALHLAWWFPACLLALPGFLFAARRIIRPREIVFGDALPLCWMAVGFLPLLLIGDRSASASMSMWSAFALWAASAWDRTPRPLRAGAIGVLIFAGASVAAIAFFAPEFLEKTGVQNVPRPLFQFAGLALLIISLVALYFSAKDRPEIALFVVLGSMVPIGLCLAEGAARLAPLFSLADAARFLNPRLGENGHVLFEGPPRRASSLTFYLNRKFFLVNQAPDFFDRTDAAREKYLDENFVLTEWDRAAPLFLIVEQSRLPHWQKLVTARVHIYHQVTTCGSYVVLSNQL
jgi:4-amino-4-deoxy-L-arabinose transferase-like glycosyltransferase